MKFLKILFLLLMAGSFGCYAQNPYGLNIISDIEDYRRRVEKDSLQALVALKKVIPNIFLDIRYATANNFMKEQMYDRPAAYLRVPAATALRAVQAELQEKGLGLKVYDGYRPYHITVAFYEKVRDSVFVASPRRGSRHNRGCAVDLTVVDLKTGKEVLMPTGYDDFSDKAHTNFQALPQEAIRNRELLKKLMVKHGFLIYPDEWWHYDFKGWEAFPLMDISFEELEEQKDP